MPPKQVSVVIRRPVDEVFDYMNDVAREPEWQPQLREALQTPPGPAAIGSERRYVSEFMGRKVENTYVIRSYEVGRRLVLETTADSALEARSEVLWEAVPEGTRVTMSVDGKPRGVLRFLPRAVVETTFASELDAALERLRDRLEGGA